MDLASFVMSGIPQIIQLYADSYKKQDLESTIQGLNGNFGFPQIQHFDFIVVGGGTAGSVVAARLSEAGNFTVLLLEEGGNPVPSTCKGHHGGLDGRSAINYEFTSLPQTNSAQTQVTKYYAGKMLGGSGSHNGNVYNRGSPKDYDNWENLTGDASWEYENILKYYKKAENYIGFLFNESERELYYGNGGPLTVDVIKPSFFDKWIAAGAELGYPAADTNGRQTEAFTTMPTTAYQGARESTYRKYIENVEASLTHKSSLTIIRYARVDQILIDESSLTAFGVRYYRHGIPQIALARKEIIISAGALISPLLLIRSGIGPKEVLTEAGIKVKVDLPGVGKNLYDHAAVFLQFVQNPNATEAAPESEETSAQMEDALNLAQDRKQSGGGPLLNFVGSQAFIFSSLAKAEGKGDWPDIQFLFMDPRFYSKGFNYALILGNSRPKSVGKMVYNTTAHLEGETDYTKLGNPDFRYFTDSNGNDMKVTIESIRIGIKVLTETRAFEGESLALDPTQIPSVCKELDPNFHSDEFWKCFIRRRTLSAYHLAGTCKMGGDIDPMAVLDSKLRVKGVKGLRVVDASIMPVVTNSNTNAPTIVIAEKTAADILSEIHQI